jgi:hypothetical protein
MNLGPACRDVGAGSTRRFVMSGSVILILVTVISLMVVGAALIVDALSAAK